MPHKNSKLILVVDDDIHVREAMADALEDDGFDVLMAVDGQDALDKLSSRTRLPDAVITDLIMPRLDGWELRHRLHAEKRLSYIPVIVLSSALNARTWPEGELPAGEFRKPPALEKLLKLVNELINKGSIASASTKVIAKDI